MATLELNRIVQALPPLLMVSPHMWIDYDTEADVLYVSFRKPQQANDSVLEDNVIYHYRDEKLVGITVIGARQLWKDV
jgi:uncharacterized protein YuzE